MKKKLKTLALTLGITTSVLLVLLAFLVFFLPYLVNLEVIRTQIANKLSKRLQAKVYLKEVRIRLIPRPTLKTKELEIEHPKYSFHLKEGDLILKLGPLFHKKIEVEKCLLEQPVFIKKKGEGPPPLVTPEKIFEITREVLPKVPPLTIQIEEGAIFFASQESREILFEKIEAELSLQPDFLEFQAKAINQALKEFVFSLRLWPVEELAEGLLKVKHLDLSLVPLIKKQNPLKKLKTDLNLDFSYRYENQKWLLGFTASAPCFLKEKPSNLIFDCAALVGQATYSPEKLRVEIKDLAMKNPALFASGYFLKEKKRAAFNFHIREGDWGAVRKRLSIFLPKIKGLKKLNEIVLAGKAKDIQLKSEAPDLKHLFHLDNFSYEGLAEEAIIQVPRLNLRLENVSGWASVKKAVLKVKEAQGNYRETNFSKVSLLLNLRKLKNKTSPLNFEGEFKTNFKDLKDILKALPLPAEIDQELNALKGEGNLFGQVKIKGFLNKPIISFSFTPVNLLLEYNRFPLPAILNDGLVTYKPHVLAVKGIEVSFPKSTIFSSFSLNLSQKPYFLNLSEARGKLFVPEIKKVLSHFPQGQELLNRFPFDGRWINLIYANYKGPLEGKNLSQKISLKAKTADFQISVAQLPGPLFIKKGTFTYQSYSLTFENSQASLLDAKFWGAGEINFKPFSLYLKGEGESGKKFLNWIYQRANISEKFFIKAPVSLEALTFKMALPEITFSSYIETSSNSKAYLGFEKTRNIWKLDAKLFTGHELPFKVNLERNNHWKINIDGQIKKQELAQFFVKEPLDFQKIRAQNFSGFINFKEPTKSHFSGYLEVHAFKYPASTPIWIEELKIKAKKKNLDIKYLEADIGETSFEARGKLSIEPKYLNFEGQVYSPLILLEDILALSKRKSKQNTKVNLIGKIDFQVDSAIYKNYEISPVEGTLFYYPEKTRVIIKKANLCDIKVWGDYEKIKEKRQLKVFFKRQNGNLANTLFCLFHQKKFEGPYDLKGSLLTSGSKELFEKSSGEVTFISQGGRIYQFGLISKLLAFLSPIDIFQGNLPDLEKEGLTYDLLKLEGHFQKKYLKIENLELNAPGLRFFAKGKVDILEKKVNLTGLVSPLKTVDTLVSNVPLVGWVLTGKSKMLVGLPLRITGDLEKPTIIPLDPTSLGTHFLGILERTFKLPVKILVPGQE
ncbi:YhdP family protein [Thermodesulfatator autotrophicus]|uniref:AsmA-like C-terminal domain-containing protein n=1 Tax=Thermodesulfatator autotrophicus TaxID=1795632 RepID=A0A177E9H0_9BACT|nr:AsmA-like C-terminal domain-containing protein [Thermodesulfatator autotrophicus]OAG28060.1 hypothetical protein TH606_03800 [Thermodesulfatator autotrophicus]